jgi:CHAT domain-containing protein
MEGRPLIVRVAEGSITKVKTLAIVLGHSQGMTPDGAERAVDEALGGAVSTFLEDRSIKGDLGDFFVIPALLASLPAQTVIIMGMGPPDLFTKQAITEKDSSSFLYQIAHRLIKGLLATDILQFATVPIGGGGAGLPPHSAVKEYVAGICHALLALDRERKINEFTIVEVDAAKLQDVHRGLEEASQEVQGQFVFDIRNIKLPEAPGSGAPSPVQKTTLLVARRKGRELTYSVYDDRPVQLMKSAEIEDDTLRQMMGELTAYLKTGQGAEGLRDVAQSFYELMVPTEIRQVVRYYAERQALILNMESSLTPIPWELCYDREAGAFLGEFSMGRQIMREETYRLLPRAGDKEAGLDILILANLSGDLPQAEEEGRELKEYLERLRPNLGSPVRVDLLTSQDLQADRKKSQILKLIYQGRYEIVHYCGHAFYDRIDPYKSGWLIDEGSAEVIRAYEFSSLPQPPVFVFSNACESAFMGDGDRSTEQEFAHSLAGAFIRAGVDLYLGNLVEVSDASARVFAAHFYEGLFQEGRAIGEALSRARRKLMEGKDLKDPTWANYVLYGSPTFHL